MVRTSFGADDPATVQQVFIPFVRRFMKTPAQAPASVHLASTPDLEQVTGRYFADSKPKKSAQRSYDEAAATRLWQVSADLVGRYPADRLSARLVCAVRHEAGSPRRCCVEFHLRYVRLGLHEQSPVHQQPFASFELGPLANRSPTWSHLAARAPQNSFCVRSGLVPRRGRFAVPVTLTLS